MTNKRYVIDTNCIINDPYITTKFEKEATCYITGVVLKELEKHKSSSDTKGLNIREFARNLYIFKQVNTKIIEGSRGQTNDESIILTAKLLKATLVTGDLYMTHIAESLGVQTIPPPSHKQEEEKDSYDYTGLSKEEKDDYYPNEFILMGDGLFKARGNGLDRAGKDKTPWGVRHGSVEQKCAIELLLDDSIQLVTITGKAGTGKTLMALAAALEKTVNDNKYLKILVSRPVVPMGNDIGFLPGDINEKMLPWIQPIMDNLEFLMESKGGKANSYEELEESGIMKIEPLMFIRGRSIPNQIMIIDEAQNLSRHELKTILTRAGKGTKIVLTGDLDQIDRKDLDRVNNGLAYAIEKFKDQDIAGHIHLIKGERSELADISSKIL